MLPYAQLHLSIAIFSKFLLGHIVFTVITTTIKECTICLGIVTRGYVKYEWEHVLDIAFVHVLQTMARQTTAIADDRDDREHTLHQFQHDICRLEGKMGVIVSAASNRTTSLDSAGFCFHVLFPYSEST
jgi:hypothetical protein